MKNEHLQAQIANAVRNVQVVVAQLPPHPFGHAFLWGHVTTYHKNGKPKVFRACLGSVCTSDLSMAVKLANSVPGVSNVYYNMD